MLNMNYSNCQNIYI